MKLKVLFVMPNLVGGGAEKVLLTILQNLDTSKYEITLLLLYDTGHYIDAPPKWINVIRGIPTVQKEISSKYFPKIFRKTNKLLFEFKHKVYRNLIRRLPEIFRQILLGQKKFDIEIAFLEGATCRLVSSWGGICQKWGWIHTDPILATEARASNTYEKLDKIICVSESVKNLMVQQYKINPISIDVIYNPVDANQIISTPETATSKRGLTAIYMGRLSEEKGVDRLIDALKIVRDCGHSLTLWIVGEGHLERILKEKVGKMLQKESVVFFGFVDCPYGLLKSADFLVCPSDYEGFSLSIAEALCLKKPILSTKTLGATELLRNGELGLLCDFNATSIAEGLAQMCCREVREKYIGKITNHDYPFDLNSTISKIEFALDYTKKNV